MIDRCVRCIEMPHPSEKLSGVTLTMPIMHGKNQTECSAFAAAKSWRDRPVKIEE